MASALSPTLKLAIAGGAAFVGLCFYLDYKRRSAPGYRESVVEKRLSRKKNASPAGSTEGYGGDPNDTEALKEYFMDQMAQGQGKLESAPLESVVHFANAIRVYGDPSSLLQILQQRLPNELFMLLLKELNIQV